MIIQNSVINGDCLDIMKDIDSESIDMILCDLPYGTTNCKWDTRIPFDLLWAQYNRIIINKGAIVLMGSQPFTSLLVTSNLKLFKYSMVWDKGTASNFLNSKKQILKCHEDILIFYNKQCTYNPIKIERELPKKYINRKSSKLGVYGVAGRAGDCIRTEKFPGSILKVSSQSKECNNINRLHPTQKPVELFEYLIRTFSNPGDLVLDNCAGSGTTAVACNNLNRNYILIESDIHYYNLIIKRLDGWTTL